MTASLPSLADSLIQALHQPGQERLLDLVRNPLRLTLLCITWDGTLPETQAQLYENYLKKFYDWNQNLQELRGCAERCQTNITALKKQLNQQLGELAKAALDLPQERFRLSQSLVEKYLGEELDDKSLCYLALQLGWLNRVGKDNRGQFIFAFYHATFQEYFAALAVEDWDYFLPRNHVNFPVAGKEYRIFEPQWKQVILLWLGRGDIVDEEKERFINKLVNFEDRCGNFYKFRAYFLGAAGIAELGEEYSKAREIVNKIVKWSFGYFNMECQEQQTNFPPQITEAAKAVLLETHRSIVAEVLIDLLTSSNEKTRIEVAQNLGKIVPVHSQAINTLMSLIDQSSVPGIRMQAVIALVEIGKNNQEKIGHLLASLCNKSDPLVSSIAAQGLGKIKPNHPKAEPFSVIIQYNSFQESVKSGKIDPSSPQVIESLINEICFSNDNFQKLNAVKNLGYTHPVNPELVIKFLIYLINNPNNENQIRNEAISSLGRIGKNSHEAINLMISFIASSQQNLEILQEVVQALQYIEINYQEVINALLNLICIISEQSIRLGVTRSLRQLLQRHPSELTILALKNCIPVDINSQQDMDIYLCCYEVLWQCAENFLYPDFYRAWHGLTEIQTLNLAHLPQLLQTQLTETNLNQTLQLFCIDGSKFDNRDNPATDIYLQLVKKHHCPKSTEGTPRTLTELKIYWQLLDWEKHPILIFYEEAKPQGFSQTFLDFLDRFDATICVITDSPHPTIPTFSPQDPHIIQTIMNWIKRTILEA